MKIKKNKVACYSYQRPSTDSVQPLSNTKGIFHRTETNSSEMCMKTQRPQLTKRILRKKNKTGSTILPVF